MRVVLPVVALLAIAPASTVRCASCSDASSTLVRDMTPIGGVPAFEPRAVELETGDGRRTIWSDAEEPVGPMEARVSRDAALARVESASGQGAADAELMWARTSVGLRLSWIVRGTPDASKLRNEIFRVDATTGSVWRLANLVSPASARAYPENPETTPTLETYELSSVLEPAETLTHPRFDVMSCVDPDGTNCDRVRHAAPDELGDFVYEPTVGLVVDDPFSEASAYVHAERFMAHMASFGVGPLFCEEFFDTRPIVLTNFLIEGDPVENGYYTGSCPVLILLGQGEEADWAYDGDVVYHEFGHAVVHERAPTFIGSGFSRPEAWVYDSRAINEAVADALAAALTGNSVIAESVISRDIESNAQCPRDLTGQRHNDSLPISGALWELYLVWGDDFEPILLDALATLPADVDYTTFAEAIASVAATVRGAEAEAEAHAAFEARGVVDCERIIELDAAKEGQWVYLDAQLGLSPLTPPPLQFSVSVDPQIESVQFDYAIGDVGLFAGPVHVSWRWDEPVDFELGGEDGTEVSIAFDDGITDLTAIGTLSFEPPSLDEPHRLYVAFSNVADGEHWVRVEELVFIDAPPVEEPEGSSSSSGDSGGGETTRGPVGSTGGEGPVDASSGSDTESADASASSGGGCRVGGTAPPWFLALMLFSLLVSSRRSPT